jgi:thiol-disulfide isomerase/thioredoxin
MRNKNIFFKSGITFIISLLFLQNATAKNDLKEGNWRAVLKLNDSTDLPFNFEIKGKAMHIINAEERIVADEIVYTADSVFIRMPLFDSEFRCKMTGDSIITGSWINYARKTKNIIPFKAEYGKTHRIWKNAAKAWGLNGKYETFFSPFTKEEYPAVGIFKTETKNGIVKVTGTFLTETGDYRYLEGASNGYNTVLTCFDGSHAFLFKFKGYRDTINGIFYSGAHFSEPFYMIKNDSAKLADPNTLTYLKPDYNKIDFSFKNLEGKKISLNDEKYKNKVVIIQLMGTWCPNCIDETKFLAGFHKKYSKKGVEVIALAFERTDDFNKAVQNVSRIKNKFSANYDFLITEKTGAQQASEALPMLNKVMAFPTTIYIDKKGVVRKIYTGFSGPATGEEYNKFVEQTTLFIEKLIAE